jgi:ATP-dependent DNA ligase
LELSRVHWVRPELVVQVKYLTWTEQGLLRQVVYQGVREDKPANEVRRTIPG